MVETDKQTGGVQTEPYICGERMVFISQTVCWGLWAMVLNYVTVLYLQQDSKIRSLRLQVCHVVRV